MDTNAPRSITEPVMPLPMARISNDELAHLRQIEKAAEAAHRDLAMCIHDRWDECLVERAYFKLKAAL